MVAIKELKYLKEYIVLIEISYNLKEWFIWQDLDY